MRATHREDGRRSVDQRRVYVGEDRRSELQRMMNLVSEEQQAVGDDSQPLQMTRHPHQPGRTAADDVGSDTEQAMLVQCLQEATWT